MVFPVCGSDTAQASEIRPLYSFNQSPLVQIYGLPALGETRIQPEDRSVLALRFQAANNFNGAQNATEELHLDGETHRLSLTWRQGLGGGYEWGVELPYLTHEGGFLDSAIDRFHNLFDMPEGGRDTLPRYRIAYRYTRDGIDRFNVSRAVTGVGDIRLLAGKQMGAAGTATGQRAALRASLKLPTGDATKLLGSGGADLAVWLSAATVQRPAAWNLYGGGGLLLMEKGRVLPSLQRNQVLFGTAGIARPVLSRFVVNAQLDAHTPFYEGSGFRQLSGYAVQGVAGFSWEWAPQRFLEFSMSEDLIVNTSSDVVIHLSLTAPF